MNKNIDRSRIMTGNLTVKNAWTEDETELESKTEENHHEPNIESQIEIENEKTNNNDKEHKDIGKILFLIFLYVLQGIPIGLGLSIPFFLSSRAVSYSDHGTFKFSSWPFSIKLLWAPMVDSIYIKQFGRRKSWIFSVQFISGILMIACANLVQNLIRSHESEAGYFIILIIND